MLKTERSPVEVGYLRFDVPSLSSGITKATLRLYTTSTSSVGYDVRTAADATWTESGLTYANAPAPSASRVASTGATKAGSWLSVDVTSLVQPGAPLALALTTTSKRAISIASRESSTTSPALVLETPAATDTTAPSVPSGVAATTSTTSASLGWSPSTDDTGVSGYGVYLDGTAVGSTADTTYVVNGLTCGTPHTFAVDAYDAAGNRSAQTAVTASTQPCPPAPTAPKIAYRFAYSNRQDQNLMPQYGYNLIDVATKSEADATPPGTLGQVWLWDYDNTTCDWELDDATISARVSAMANDPKVAGFYFANESDPIKCPNAIQQHRARNALIKSLAPNKYTVLAVDSNWREHFDTQVPMWKGVADYLVFNPYICYVGHPCDYAWLDHVLAAAEANGTPYFIALQAFAEGNEWRWPSAAEERQMLDRLKDSHLLLLHGYYTFSWDWNNDRLLDHPDVLQEIQNFNLWATASWSATP